MYAHYEVTYYDDIDTDMKKDHGVVCGDDEGVLYRSLRDYYGDIAKVTLWFDDNYDCNVIPNNYCNISEELCI